MRSIILIICGLLFIGCSKENQKTVDTEKKDSSKTVSGNDKALKDSIQALKDKLEKMEKESKSGEELGEYEINETKEESKKNEVSDEQATRDVKAFFKKTEHSGWRTGVEFKKIKLVGKTTRGEKYVVQFETRVYYPSSCQTCPKDDFSQDVEVIYKKWGDNWKYEDVKILSGYTNQ